MAKKARAGKSSDARQIVEWPLTERPGFLVRRLHQIHISLFMDVCAGFKITPLQYSVLSVLAACGTTDQTKLAAAVALDRTTTTGIVKRLHERGLTQRETSETDRRAQACSLTAAGKSLLRRMETSARKAHRDTLAPLPPQEQATLLALLSRVVAAHSDVVGSSAES